MIPNNLMRFHHNNRYNFKKSTYTGTSLSIQNTVNAPIERLEISGASSQNVSVQSKNLLDLSLINGSYNGTNCVVTISNGHVVITPTVGSINESFHIKIPYGRSFPAGTYTFRINNKTSGTLSTYNQLSFLIKEGNGSELERSTNSTITFTDSWILTGIRVYFRTSGTTPITTGQFNDYWNIQIELGATATAYTPFVPDSPSPYYPSTITNVVNPVVTVNSANIVQNGNFANGGTGWVTGGCTISATNNKLSALGNGTADYIRITQTTALKRLRQKFYIKVGNVSVLDANCTKIEIYIAGVSVITINYPVIGQWYNNQSFVLKDTTGDNNSVVVSIKATYADAITANGKTMEVKDVIAIDMGADSTNPLYNLTTAQMDTLFANWSDYKSTAINLIATLRSLPNGVKDRLIINKGTQTAWIERNVGNVVLNGSENWTAYREHTNYYVFYTNDRIYGNSSPISDKFKTTVLDSTYIAIDNNLGDLVVKDITSSRGYLFIQISKPILNNVYTSQALKSWFAGNNVTVQYQLTMSVTESITYPNIATIQYLTNISTSPSSNISADVLVLGN